MEAYPDVAKGKDILQVFVLRNIWISLHQSLTLTVFLYILTCISAAFSKLFNCFDSNTCIVPISLAFSNALQVVQDKTSDQHKKMVLTHDYATQLIKMPCKDEFAEDQHRVLEA
ncbi:hypothetical protein ABBQ38_013536 [Trebouxia sp. C0009 RCD-2024]